MLSFRKTRTKLIRTSQARPVGLSYQIFGVRLPPVNVQILGILECAPRRKILADIGMRGKNLIAMIALAKKSDLNFAYCPGNDAKEDVFVLDRRRKPEILGRAAKSEGTGTKLCYGSASITGKVMSLTCDKTLDNVAKKLEKFLKSEALSMNVIVLDEFGNLLEQHTGDLGEDDLANEKKTAAEIALENAAKETRAAEDAKIIATKADNASPLVANGTDDKATMLQRLKAIATQVKAAIQMAPAAVRPPLVKEFKKAVAALQGNDFTAAEASLTKIAGALNKLTAATNTTENTEEKGKT